MNAIKKTLLSLLVLSIAIPADVQAGNHSGIKNKILNAKSSGLHILNEIEKSGTTFYLDSTRRVELDLSEFLANRKQRVKFYGVLPYDQKLNTRIAFAQSITSHEDGSLSTTIELMKNGSERITAFPIRAIKSVKLSKEDAVNSQIKFKQAIQAAIRIAKNQIVVVDHHRSNLKKFMNSVLNSIIPTAKADSTDRAYITLLGISAAACVIHGSFTLGMASAIKHKIRYAVVILGITEIFAGIYWAHRAAAYARYETEQ